VHRLYVGTHKPAAEFGHCDLDNEERHQSIGAQTVADWISQTLQLLSPQAFPFEVIWSLRIDDPTIGVDARRPCWI